MYLIAAIHCSINLRAPSLPLSNIKIVDHSIFMSSSCMPFTICKGVLVIIIKYLEFDGMVLYDAKSTAFVIQVVDELT